MRGAVHVGEPEVVVCQGLEDVFQAARVPATSFLTNTTRDNLAIQLSAQAVDRRVDHHGALARVTHRIVAIAVDWREGCAPGSGAALVNIKLSITLAESVHRNMRENPAGEAITMLMLALAANGDEVGFSL